MTTRLRAVDLDWLINFVNEYGTEPRRVAGEEQEAYPPLGTLGEHDLSLTADLDEAQLVALADRLYGAFRSSEAGAVEVLNELLTESAPSPRVFAGDEGHEVYWAVEDWATDVVFAPLMAACALTLMDVLTGPRLFGVCNAARCVDAFVDRSPGGQRRYCSSLCQNRAKVAAFRDRQAARER